MDQLEDEDKDEDREETVEEKIDRLGRETDDLYEQLRRLLSSSSSPSPSPSPPLPLPRTLPPVRVPEPLLKLRRAIKEKHTERELLLEDQRVSKVAEEYLRENPSILEKVDECPVCLEPIFDVDGAVVSLCCGKQTCKDCLQQWYAVNDTCVLCREGVPRESEVLGILLTKAAAGTAWAQCCLGSKYYHGLSGLAADKRKAESLYRKAVDQGYSIAQCHLGRLERARDNGSEACQLFEDAASQGHMNALGRVAAYYCGDEEDEVKSARLFAVSAKLQKTDPFPLVNLGYLFALGEGGLQQSNERSMYYFKLAIEKSFLPPEFMIDYALVLHKMSAMYYPDCEIVPSGYNSFPEALFWYRRASADSVGAEAVELFDSYESKIKAMCASCYKSLTTETRKCCVECRAVYYCNRECQAADWKAGHKKDCVKSLKKRLRASGKFDDV